MLPPLVAGALAPAQPAAWPEQADQGIAHALDDRLAWTTRVVAALCLS
jgi:hypothetical protein